MAGPTLAEPQEQIAQLLQGRQGLAPPVRSEDELITSTQTVAADGTLRIISFPAVIGKQSGNASLRLVGAKCDLTIEYKWGTEAMVEQ